MVVENHKLILEKNSFKVSLPIVDEAFIWDNLNYINKNVHILASGPSINSLNLHTLQNKPVMFVNGSLSLSQSICFSQPVAYVVSDGRFIKHNLDIIITYYQGQCPFYITQTVAKQLAEDAPEFLVRYQDKLYIVFAIDRSLQPSKHLAKRWFNKVHQKLCFTLKLEQFRKSPYYRIHDDIGVSLDIRHGFVEAGTVAFVAMQLAYSLGFNKIHLYGIDLLNSQTPRFYENTQNAAPSKLKAAVTNRIVPSLDWAAQIYQNEGVLVYNHSPVSKDLFHYISYQS